jgi:lipopolysaccharide transport system ATP-binding protein
MVTHDIHAVLRHCDKALLIDHGAIIDAGQPQKVVRAYFDIIDGTASKQEQAGTAVLPTSDTFNDSFKANFHESLVEEFLRSIPERDNCVNRKSYNSNEVRQGVREAEIVDYLVICGDRCDPTTVQNGEIVHIYVKAIFHVATSAPIVGFEVQTTDGLVAYGWHNQLKKISITRLDPVTLIVFKISFVLRLAAGDYFVSLGLASETGGTYETRERRWGLIHLRVDATEHFGGLSDLGATGEEILRRKLG